MTWTGRASVENLPHFQGRIRDMLAKFHLQVIETDERLPGFILGDVPVVHALLATQRFGFRDRLALGDSDFVAGPISRRVAVLFTKDRLPHTRVQTKRLVSKFNVMTLFAADREVARHPDDTRSLRQLWLYREQHRSFSHLAGK